MHKLSLVVYLLAVSTLGISGENYKVLLSSPQQKILGLGVEIQSDSIGSGNNGLPDEVVAVPHDLVDSEKMRLYTDMLKGFRYLRLAMGLYLRGNDASRKYIIERYEGQMEGLANLTYFSGIEGVDVEYWSPAPYWKSTGQYINGSLRAFDDEFLSDFGDALVTDINYLQDHGIKVKMWGLQNEPQVGPQSCTYSCCGYDSKQYYTAFKAVAPKIKKNFPDLYVHVDSEGGQQAEPLIVNDPTLLPFFDAWTWHRIGINSDECISSKLKFNTDTKGKDVFNNEYEYFSDVTDYLCINTAQSIMNWLAFENSPTWYWLHALKPTYNSEANGFGLGFWRPWDDNDTTHFPNIKKGYWDYNNQNFNSIAGFLKYMPWDSQRVAVAEAVVRFDNRILAFTTPAPAKKVVFVITNRGSANYTFNITFDNLNFGTGFDGHLYTPSARDVNIGTLKLDDTLTLTRVVEKLSIEFWVQR